MLQDVVHPPERLAECISRPITAPFLDFSGDDELFPETLHTLKSTAVAATANLCHRNDEDNKTKAAFPPFASMDFSSLSALLNTPPYGGNYSTPNSMLPMAPLELNFRYQQPVYEECLPPLPSAYVEIDAAPQCTYMDNKVGAFHSTSGKNPGLFLGGTAAATGTGFSSPGVVEYQKLPDSIQSLYCFSDIQVNGDNQQHLVSSGCSSTLDDPCLKVGRLSVEERKEKIHRYMKKRNERNFSKKIKYACRKTLADSRPRVRGRFAKNDELGDTARNCSRNHEFDEDDEVVMKEEEDLLDSSEILAYISGVNSFKYNYTLESWM